MIKIFCTYSPKLLIYSRHDAVNLEPFAKKYITIWWNAKSTDSCYSGDIKYIIIYRKL